MKQNVLIYGCYGYTGKLVSEQAVKSGLKPVLAGRDEKQVKALADTLQLPYLCFDLTDENEVAEKIMPFKVVLHCAGPFMYTAPPMVNACIKTGTHYLDITGEYRVFEQIFKRDAEAAKANTLLMPGVGFDVVPSDCLALFLKELLPTADSLELALLHVNGKVSHGTAITIIENMDDGSVVRRRGKIQHIKNGSITRDVKWHDSKHRKVVAIPWGDVSTAYRSTSIPNITVYSYLPTKAMDNLRLSNYFKFLLRSKKVKQFLINRAKQKPSGPNELQRTEGKSFIWGQVKNGLGVDRKAILELPEGYLLTALTAVKIADYVLHNPVPYGAKTPAQVFGKDFIMQFDGVLRKELN